MTRGAMTLLETCVAVKPGETVLIVTDMVKFAIARVIAAAALGLGRSRLTATARRTILTRRCRFRGTIRSIIVAGRSSLLCPPSTKEG